jgi:hypothetical protein
MRSPTSTTGGGSAAERRLFARVARSVVTIGVLAAAAAQAQPAPPPPELPADAPVATEVEIRNLRTAFEFGRYVDALTRAEDRLALGGLTRPQVVELHQLAGLSAFNVGQKERAKQHFQALLRIDPDHALDPFSVPPPAVAFFNKVKSELGEELAHIRETLRLEAQRLHQEQEERLLSQREATLAKRQLEDLTQRTVQRVEHHSLLPNFIPFGVGQFEQGRVGWGVTFAVSEGVLAGASIVAFWIYQLEILAPNQVYSFSGSNLPPNQLIVEGIPASRAGEATFWRDTKLATGIGFYAVYVLGVTEALLHFKEVTSTTIVQDAPPLPRTGIFLAPGGAGVAFSERF